VSRNQTRARGVSLSRVGYRLFTVGKLRTYESYRWIDSADSRQPTSVLCSAMFLPFERPSLPPLRCAPITMPLTNRQSLWVAAILCYWLTTTPLSAAFVVSTTSTIRRTTIFQRTVLKSSSENNDTPLNNNIRFLGRGDRAVVRPGVVLVAPQHEYNHFCSTTLQGASKEYYVPVKNRGVAPYFFTIA